MLYDLRKVLRPNKSNKQLANRHTRAINNKVIRLIHFLSWRLHNGHWRRVHSRCYNATQKATDLFIFCKFYETNNEC